MRTYYKGNTRSTDVCVCIVKGVRVLSGISYLLQLLGSRFVPKDIPITKGSFHTLGSVLASAHESPNMVEFVHVCAT